MMPDVVINTVSLDKHTFMPTFELPDIFTLHNAANQSLQSVVGGPLSLWALILQSTHTNLRRQEKLQTSCKHPANHHDMCFEIHLLCLNLTCSLREGSSNEVPILVVGNKRDLQRQRFMPRRAVSVLVKKTWKCGYVECSAKFNWHVVLLFKELLGIAVARGMRQNHTSIRLQGALQRNRCTIMWPRELSPPFSSQEWSSNREKKDFLI